MVDTSKMDLREAARHRGLRLVKSRRRKPGVGDYGMFGLTGADGQQIYGFSEEGLTATPDDILSFLRGGDRKRWKTSAAAAKPAVRKAATKLSDDGAAAAKRPAKPQSIPPPAVRPKAVRLVKEPQPLRVRSIQRSEVPALIAFLSDEMKVEGDPASYVASMQKAGGRIIVARRDDLVGCAAWVTVPALHSALTGRIATLFVAERQRRQGIGTALVSALRQDMLTAGCEAVEVMSDIDIRNAHGFLRRLGFKQVSYRFRIGTADT